MVYYLKGHPCHKNQPTQSCLDRHHIRAVVSKGTNLGQGETSKPSATIMENILEMVETQRKMEDGTEVRENSYKPPSKT